jgi:adenylate cyclase
MEVAAVEKAQIALSDVLYRAAGSACSVFDSGTLNNLVDAPIRGRAGSVSIWLWRGKVPERPPPERSTLQVAPEPRD